MEFSVNGSVRSLKRKLHAVVLRQLEPQLRDSYPIVGGSSAVLHQIQRTGVSRGDFPGLLQD